MNGVEPTTVAEASVSMAEGLGLRLPEDRVEVVKYLNKFRRYIYDSYDKYKLFDNTFHCVCVSSFRELCDGCDTYHGVTLPPDILSVVSVFSYGNPLTIRTRHREGHTGVGVGGSRISAIEMAEMFATERDLQAVTTLKVFSELADDNDKFVYVDVIDADHRQKRIGFRLMGDGWSVSRIKVRKITGVSLPVGRVGCITLSQCDGYELSQYAPWQTVPSYRRLKLPGCHGSSVGSTKHDDGVVLIQGVKKFQKVYFDHDIVEIGSSSVLEAAGRFYRYGEKTTEANEIKRSALDLATMDTLLKGAIARNRGAAIQDGNPFKGLRITRSKALPGYRK